MRLGRTRRFVYGRRGLIFGLEAGDESLICLREQSREQVRPLALTSFVRDKVLADFNRNVMQAASLTMHRNRVIRRIGHAVRRVVADDKPLLAFQQRHEEMRETRIAITRELLVDLTQTIKQNFKHVACLPRRSYDRGAASKLKCC